MDKEKVARVYKRYQTLYLFLSVNTGNEIADWKQEKSIIANTLLSSEFMVFLSTDVVPF